MEEQGVVVMTGICKACVYVNACGTSGRTMPCEGRKTLNECERCVICGQPIVGMGNNPWPIKDEGSCCSVCNFTHVVPARLAKLAEDKEVSS